MTSYATLLHIDHSLGILFGIFPSFEAAQESCQTEQDNTPIGEWQIEAWDGSKCLGLWRLGPSGWVETSIRSQDSSK